MIIYSVTVFNEKPHQKRTWYLCEDFESAEKAIVNNEGDIFEQFYEYGIIEEIEVFMKDKPYKGGIPKQWWYKAEYKDGDEFGDGDPIVKRCSIPEVYKNVICWSIG